MLPNGLVTWTLQFVEGAGGNNGNGAVGVDENGVPIDANGNFVPPTSYPPNPNGGGVPSAGDIIGAIGAGVVIGGKAVINQGAKAGAGAISIGLWNPGDIITVTADDRAFGYDTSAFFARIGAEAGLLALTLKLSSPKSCDGGCFSAGTRLLTPTGYKAIEQIKVGDEVLAKSDLAIGLVEAKQVEKVFVLLAPILNLHVGGQVIRTTGEHPFYVRGKGWKPAQELIIGDLLSSHDEQWVAVEDIFNNEEFEPVYNLRVADFHTYFVGCEDWGFSVWAHNTYGWENPLAKRFVSDIRSKSETLKALEKTYAEQVALGNQFAPGMARLESMINTTQAEIKDLFVMLTQLVG